MWQAASVSGAKRPGRQRRLAVRGYPAWLVAVVAVALLALPWVIALALVRHHHLDFDDVSILVAVSIPLSGLWLTWVTLAKGGGSAPASGLATAKMLDQLPAVVRVVEADPRRLGVHATISLPGVPDEVPPEYVPRDVDADEFGVRARVTAAAQSVGFVLLVGGSSVGKTRCAVEAVKALLPDWWLVHPAGPGEVAALAQAPGSRIVVWLDELQRYFDGEKRLTGGVVRALLNAPHPLVIIGTLWPDLYAAYTTVPTSGGADPFAADPFVREREVLALAVVVRIGQEFSPAEQGRARAAAARDPRLRVALDAAGYGLTQTLAAAPQLVARWEDARTASPYGWSVLTAALDVARFGARAPLSTDFLRAAALGYCTSQQQAEAPDHWFDQALTYATGKLNGTVAALTPAGVGMGRVAGYNAADYLTQHASRERRSAGVPASTWDAVLSYIHDPADTVRLAYSLLESWRPAEALSVYDDLVRRFVHACEGIRRGFPNDRAVQVTTTIFEVDAYRGLGQHTKALKACDHVVDLIGSDPDVGSRRLVARLLRVKAHLFWAVRRGDDVPSVCEEIDRQFGADQDPILRQEVAQALLDKGKALGQCDRWDQAAAVMDTIVARYGEDADPVLKEMSARARSNKIVALGQIRAGAEDHLP